MFISSHVTAIVTSYMMSKFGIRKKVQERSNKNLIIVLCIEFYEFWWKPQLNRIKWRKITGNWRNSNFPPHDHIWSTLRGFKGENNDCVCNGEKTNLHKVKIVVFLISHIWCYEVYFVMNYVIMTSRRIHNIVCLKAPHMRNEKKLQFWFYADLFFLRCEHIHCFRV